MTGPAFALFTSRWNCVPGLPFCSFASLHSISGGSHGTSRDRDKATGEGYTRNSIELVALSVGLVANLDAF